jgi:hypothetical protein
MAILSWPIFLAISNTVLYVPPTPNGKYHIQREKEEGIVMSGIFRYCINAFGSVIPPGWER